MTLAETEKNILEFINKALKDEYTISSPETIEALAELLRAVKINY